jgi:DNA-binding LacI/PurR family transcriptional regulator
MDNYRAGQLAAERLLLHGHRKLAFLMVPVHSIACSDRLKGFSDAVRSCDDAVLHVVNTSGIRLEESYQAMLQLLAAGNLPTAIAAADDFIAIGAWQALREKMLAVGSEYALIGFGNTPFAALPKHGLSSVGPEDPDLASIAVQLLLDMQNGQTSASHRILTPQLVSRSTF